MSGILISGLRANEVLLNNASSNVANMNTQDYKSIRTTITEGSRGSVDTVTTRSTVEGVPTGDGHFTSNVDLPEEFGDIILAQRGFEAVLSAIKTREEMMNDLMSEFTGKD